MKLEKLQAVSYSRKYSFPKCCPSLLELNLFPSIGTTRMLDEFCWERIGSELESLVISGVFVSQDNLRRIREHCRNLRRIDMDLQDEECYAEFTASYGRQLDFVYVHNMKENQLNRVFEGCRNARFSAFISSNDLLLPTQDSGASVGKVQDGL